MPIIIEERNPITPFTGPPDYDFDRLDKRLRSTETKFVYVGVPDPDYEGGKRRWWDLSGSQGGRQALELAPHIKGIFHAPFQSLFTEGPYQLGATYERSDFRKRVINFAVMVSSSLAPDTSFRYRMLEQRWWASWSEKEDGYLGCFTRTHGWRWLRVRLASEPKTPFELDPVAFENNFMQWDMEIVAVQPFWAKRIEHKTWMNPPEFSLTAYDAVRRAVGIISGEEPVELSVQALIRFAKKLLMDEIQPQTVELELAINSHLDTIRGFMGWPTRGTTAFEHPIGQLLVDIALQGNNDIGEGFIRIPNRGNVPAWPKFLVSSPGYAWVQDGIDGRMVQLPLLTPRDGSVVMVDTDPTQRTLTGEKDPVDSNFLKILRNSQLVKLLLHDQVSVTEPLWKRFGGKGFDNPIPPRTLATLKVRHSDENGTITCMLPQHFRTPYG